MLKKFISIFAFCGAAAFLFFFLAAQIPLWSSDEGRFAEIARGMIASHNWIVPYFNGLPYLEKPIFAVWTTALSFQAFGITAFTARLPGILSGLAGLVAVFLFTRRLFDKQAAICATLCLMTTVGYVLVARFAVIDMQMIFFLSVSLFAIMIAIFEHDQRYHLLAAGLMGVTILLKGLIGGALPFLIFLTFALLNKRMSEFKKVPWLSGILILLAITVPWIWAILQKQPEFLDVFFFEHQFKRFTTGGFGRARPFYFFTYVFLIAAFPWCLFLPASIRQSWKTTGEQRQKLFFLICWIGVVFVFFSIPRSKLPYYIVPACVPTAVLVGVFLSKWLQQNLTISPTWAQWSWRIFSSVFLLGVVGINIALLFSDRVPELAVIRPWAPIGTLFLALGGGLSFYFNRRHHRVAAFFSVITTIYCVFLLIFYCMLKLSPLMSTESFSNYLKNHAHEKDIVAVFASPDSFSDLPFYLRRRIVVVGTDRGTLTQESAEKDETDAEGWFYSASDFAALAKNSRPNKVFCLLKKDKTDELQKAGLTSFQILMESHGRILIASN